MSAPFLEKIPSSGLALALDEGLRALAFKHAHPVLAPFVADDRIKKNRTNLHVYSARSPYTSLYVLGPMFVREGEEPDVKITIRETALSKVSHAWAVLHQLKEWLPGVRLSQPHDLVNIDPLSPLEEMVEIVIERDSLISAFSASHEECFRRPFDRLSSWTKAYAHAKNKALSDKNDFDFVSYFAASKASGGLSDDPFFCVQDFPKLFNEGFDPDAATTFSPIINGSVAASLTNSEGCASDISSFMTGIGIRRLAFISSGIRSFAVLPLQERGEVPRILVLSPSYDKIPNSPFHLPAYHVEKFGDVMLRVMPKLSFEENKKAIDEMLLALTMFDLPTTDVERHNVAYYSFKDEMRQTRKIPMIFDWDSGPERLSEKTLSNLNGQPSLSLWQAAHRHIANQRKEALTF